jgi:GAF domain-containing protein
MLPDFRVRQRDYLLEISRALTQELDLEKLLARILRISIEMLAGQAGLIALKEQDGWRVTAAHGIAPAFMSYLTPLLAGEKVRELDVDELNRMLKNLTYTASKGLLNGVGLPLSAHEQLIGVIFIFRNYPDLFSPNDRRLLQSFADQAATVYNAQLYGQVTYGSAHSMRCSTPPRTASDLQRRPHDQRVSSRLKRSLANPFSVVSRLHGHHLGARP